MRRRKTFTVGRVHAFSTPPCPVQEPLREGGRLAAFLGRLSHVIDGGRVQARVVRQLRAHGAEMRHLAAGPYTRPRLSST